MVIVGELSKSLAGKLRSAGHFYFLPLRSISSKNQEENLPKIPDVRRSGQESRYKRGGGGRMSFSGNVCTIFGNTGFFGKYLINQLSKDGTQIILPHRCSTDYVRYPKTCGDLGQILSFEFDVRDEESIQKVVKYSNIVINLIGTDHETRNFSFYDVHEDAARKIARISRECGVDRFIQMSALNASLNPEPFLIPGGSQFLRSKAKGELAVKEEFPNATIIRPSDMYGYMDCFIHYILSYAKKSVLLSLVGLYRSGENIKMPVYPLDVALGIQRIVNDPTLDGEIYEFTGPYAYKMHDIVRWNYEQAGIKILNRYSTFRLVSGLSLSFMLLSSVMEAKTLVRKSKPAWNWERIERIEALSDVLTGCPTLADIGIAAKDYELASRNTVDLNSYAAYYEPTPDQFGVIEPLTRLPPLQKQQIEARKRADFDLLEKERILHQELMGLG